MNRILILKFPYRSTFGGGERHTVSLVSGLRRKGFTFYLVSSCPVLLREFRQRGWYCRKLWAGIEPVTKVSVLLFPLLAPLVVIELFFVLLYFRLVKKVTIVYCLSLTEKLLMAPLARLLGYKVFWSELRWLGRSLFANPYRFFYRWQAKLVTVVTVSRGVMEQLVMLGVRPEKIEVIYCGVNLAQFSSPPGRVERKFRHDFIVGTVCRLDREKGLEYLLQATQKVRSLIPHLSLIVVGDGPERATLEWLARKIEVADVTQFVGLQKEVEKWYPLFDVFVLPSVRGEAFGIVLIEALAAEIPVIASRIGAIPEIIEDGRTGYLVTPASSEVLAEKIFEVYRDYPQAKLLARQGRERVEHRFTEEMMTEKFYQLFFRNLSTH